MHSLTPICSAYLIWHLRLFCKSFVNEWFINIFRPYLCFYIKGRVCYYALKTFFLINWSVSLAVCGLLTKMSLTPLVYCMLIQCSHKWYIMSAHNPSPVHASFGSSLFEIQVGVFQNVFSVKVSRVEYIPDQPYNSNQAVLKKH